MVDYHSQVVSSLGAGVLLVGGDRVVLFANDRSRDLLGRDLTGVCLEPAVLQDDPPLLGSVASVIGEAGPGGRAEILIDKAEGSARYLWACVSEAGEGSRILLLMDISEALSGADALKRIFSQINHDLRSPLTSISGGAELLLSGRVGALDGVQKKLVTIIEDSSRKIHEILQETKERLLLKGAAAGGGGE